MSYTITLASGMYFSSSLFFYSENKIRERETERKRERERNTSICWFALLLATVNEAGPGYQTETRSQELFHVSHMCTMSSNA